MKKFETVILLIKEDLIYNNIRLEDLLEMELNESILEKIELVKNEINILNEAIKILEEY